MATIKFHDMAEEFRIIIAGRFAGEIVEEVLQAWENALAKPRKFVVDISRMLSYDHRGRSALQKMHNHGTQIGAKTPLSLVFLNEISARAQPVPLQEVPTPKARAGSAKKPTSPFPLSRVL